MQLSDDGELARHPRRDRVGRRRARRPRGSAPTARRSRASRSRPTARWSARTCAPRPASRAARACGPTTVVSSMSTIIRLPGRPFGVLGAYAVELRPFDDDDITFARSVANLLGASFARREVEEELRGRELEARLAFAAGRMGSWRWDSRRTGCRGRPSSRRRTASSRARSPGRSRRSSRTSIRTTASASPRSSCATVRRRLLMEHRVLMPTVRGGSRAAARRCTTRTGRSPAGSASASTSPRASSSSRSCASTS